MIHLKDNFKIGAPISQVPASWFNQVSSFINNLVGGYGIKVDKNTAGAASTISIDPKVLDNEEGSTKDYQKFETPSADDTTTPDYHREDALLKTTWVRGTVGVSVYLPTDSWGTNVNRNTAWRLCHFDKRGRLVRIDAQTIITKALNNEVLNN